MLERALCGRAVLRERLKSQLALGMLEILNLDEWELGEM